MPLDEKQKQELLKMINEQHQAMLIGRSSTKSRRKKITPKKVEPSYLQSDLGSGIEKTYQENHIYDSLAEDIKHTVKKRSKLASQIKAELRKTFDLNWKIVLIVTMSLIGAMMIGLVIGYLFSIINKYT